MRTCYFLLMIFKVLFIGLFILIMNQSSLGCHRHYRSPEWLVVNSPLVVIGTVEKVEKLPREGEQKDEYWRQRSIAEIRIDRILKGRYSQKTFRLRSGPILNCESDDINYPFHMGNQHLFLLPFSPVEGEAAVVWRANILPVDRTAMIESRILNARSYQTDYLTQLQKEQPEVHKAAETLVKKIRMQSVNWPKPVYQKWKNFDECHPGPAWEIPESPSEKKKLITLLAEYDSETIRAAQAIDWFSDDPQIWFRNPFWIVTLEEIAEQKKSQTEVIERKKIRTVLVQVGVEKELIDQYMASKLGFDVSLKFPPCPPSFDLDFTNTTLATDFILNYHSYDRGAMFSRYIDQFFVFADLDPIRAKPCIISLFRSDDEHLKHLARTAIECMPGTEYTDLILDELVRNNDPFAWRMLSKFQDSDAMPRRLKVLLERASIYFNKQEISLFWDALRQGKCFEKPCIENALVHLEEIEKKWMVKNDKKDQESRYADNLEAALHRYLAAAMNHREGNPLKKHSASEYRQWFKDHPEKKKDE